MKKNFKQIFNDAKEKGINSNGVQSERVNFIGCDFIPLAEHCYNLITGQGASGKSFLALQILIRQARQGKRCLAWSTEDSAGVTKHRIETICRHVLNYKNEDTIKAMSNIDILDVNVNYRFVVKKKGDAILNSEDILSFQEMLLDYDITLLDPLKSFHGVDESDNSQMDLLVRDLFQASASLSKCTLVVIHHTAKGGSEDRISSRGASTISDSARLGLEVVAYMKKGEINGKEMYLKDPEKKHLLQVLPRKDNHNASKYFINGFDFVAFPKREIEEPIITEMQEETEIVPEKHFNVSISKDMTKGYEISKVKFERLKHLLKSDYNYSCQIFKNGYRDLTHYMQGSNLIGLDVDDGLTINEAQELFSKYKNIIATTKSHQKDKNGLVCDRFRVILPCDKDITLNAEDFKLMMMEVHREYSFVDKQCSNVSRFYYPNKEAQIIENLKGDYFNWEYYYKKALNRKELEKKALELKRQEALDREFDEATESDITDALLFIDPNCDYDTWIKIGMAIHEHTNGSGFDIWNCWSAGSSKYDGEQKLMTHWKSFGKNSDIKINTLFYFAIENGYEKAKKVEIHGI